MTGPTSVAGAGGAPATPASPGGQVAEVLVVDDTSANLTLLASMIRSCGYRVRPVPSGELALQAARARPPDLVLLDVDMPEMNGYEVCRRLKADPLLSEIPVIFISALSDTWDKVEAFSAGGVDYVAKPFHFEEIRARMATHLELRWRQAALRAAYEKLCEAERLRDGLVHMMVHDMRSPLSVLLVDLQTLQDEFVGDAGSLDAEVVGEAVRCTRHVIRMTNDLLDVSRFEAQGLPIDFEECDLALLIRSSVNNVFAARDASLVSIEGQGPLRWICDQALVGRLVENLLNNARKHSPTSRPILVVFGSTDEGVRVTVHDEGAGVPATLRDRIFEKYASLRAREALSYHSVGVGLAFCKLVVDAHGGRIGVESEPDRGTTFWFTLPVRPPVTEA
ncbi:MAG: hybrid sensor histidine kinase/response regulator [Polyangiaceae bacterium]|nr:hybrid sensor histidine kinase/response regulator [Polyangiaceae bacterium]